MTPEQVMMLCDVIDSAGREVLWAFLISGGIVLASVTAALFIGLAIRRTIRYLWHRMAEGSL